MKLHDLIAIIDQPFDTVSVYDTTESIWHNTLYEGPAYYCPANLMHRDVCSIYATDEGDGLLCIGLHNDLDKED